MKEKINLIVAVTGASGSIYASLLLRDLEKLRDQIGEAAILFSGNARSVWNYELGRDISFPSFFTLYANNDFYAPIASGSGGFDCMIICPCSMGTLGRIAAGTSEDLLLRSADVMIKERKKLVLVPRETPFSLIHLNNLKLLSEAGAIIVPAIPSFYSRPATVEELAQTVVDKVLGQAGFEKESFKWGKDSGNPGNKYPEV
jgi:4-hydroxy-3-polyprenylbenzoate decarboxylase